ncbi:MAG TPA: asparagine synthase (glutamine-hydrolyzing) [Candidatus Kapabacteria bacterium]|nr:asparagine synthase (glutamine-hydrolyzing) [Candidatus Kapabacteria bacterium]
MCGILGAINILGEPLVADEGRCGHALTLMEHRGPDDSGEWRSADGSVYLGHRRLSIIDLSAAGHQPMCNEDGTIWIVYNGECYNFRELRAELEQRGHVFRSATDTETIIHGYEEYGAAIVQRLRGMFAFALYDSRRHTMLMARDRAGIKPIYYAWAGSTLYLASEIAPLLAMPGIERRLDLRALREYFAFGKVYPPRTMFQGIFKFPAGHRATVDASGMHLEEYWTPYRTALSFPPDAGEEYHAGRLLRLLEESVRLRMLSDVPVGVFLSGGVDSTANVALMSRVSGSRVHSFTAGFAGQDAYDERVHARDAAREYGTLHEEIEITRSDLVTRLPRLASFLDEPVADPTVIPIYYLSQLARASGAIVILNGDGGDELFCGYRKYMQFLRLAKPWRALNALPVPVRRALAAAGRAAGLRGVRADLLDRAARGVEMYVGSTGPLKGTPAFDEIAGQGDELYEAVRAGRAAFNREHRGGDYAEWLSYWGVRSEIENVFLYRADRMGMANSVEIRVPFLDHNLIEFAMQMPQEWKHRNGETKYILKRALAGVVPDRFLYRRKQGFNVPLREWAGGTMDAEIRDVLPRLQSDWNAFSPAFLQGALSMLGTGDADANGALSWMLFNLAVWYRQWFM